MHGIGPSRKPVDGFQRERLLDKRIANCSGLYQSSNCNGDPYWRPERDGETGDWRNYPGIGFNGSVHSAGTMMVSNRGNPSGFSGSLRTTDASNCTVQLSQYDAPLVSAYSTVSTTDLEVIKERTVQNCNCGMGGPGTSNYNCYTNCNCNCHNCQCQCQCDCHNCFPAGTPVTMADGTAKPIEDIAVGDLVKGAFGIANKVEHVGIGPIRDYPAYILNGRFFIPGAHRIWSIDRGWIAPDPAAWFRLCRENKPYFEKVRGVTLPEGGVLAPTEYQPKQMVVGDRLAWGCTKETITVELLEPISHDGRLTLYELTCQNGSGSYEVYGGLWAVASPDYSFPFHEYVMTAETSNDARFVS